MKARAFYDEFVPPVHHSNPEADPIRCPSGQRKTYADGTALEPPHAAIGAWVVISTSFALMFTMIMPLTRKGLCAETADGSLVPRETQRFFITPGQPAELRFHRTVAGRPAGAETLPKFSIFDYWGNPAAEGETQSAGDGVVTAAVKLPQGYYEIALAGDGRRYGIVCLPAVEAAKADPFFAIDCAASWLVRSDALRHSYARVLGRSGILMARERLTWGAIHPSADRWEWESGARFESLRRTYAAESVAVLEMFHDSPAWMGRVGKYPDDLIAAARSWRSIAARWGELWGGLEVWNEPDIFFGGDMPADQYVALVKTLAYVWRDMPRQKPLVGGALAHAHPRFLDAAARNGLLEVCDAFSFHSYEKAPQMESLVAGYRRWQHRFGRPQMPLWITECGRPWPKGTDRPAREPDAISALDITMKAVEAKALGVERYFAFVHPFYEENQHNFGMMGREGTPLRSMAAYAFAALALAGKKPMGDLPPGEARVVRARVFGNENEAECIVVVYTGKPEAGAAVPFELPVLRAAGIDGRAIQPEANRLPVPDGLTYAWVDRAAVQPRLIRPKPEAPGDGRPEAASSRSEPAPSNATGIADAAARLRGPIVLRFQYSPEQLKPSAEGYRWQGALPGELRLTVRVFNLSEQPHRVWLRAEGAGDGAGLSIAEPTEQQVEVPSGAWRDLTWTCRCEPATEQFSVRSVRVGGRVRQAIPAESPPPQADREGNSPNDEPILPLAVDFIFARS